MAHSLSAQKRVRQSKKRNTINKTRKSQVKRMVKSLEESIKEGNTEAAQTQLKDVCRKLDKVSATSTLHKKTAARKKSRLTRKVNSLSSN